jgi:hypothetical protein
MKRKIKQFFPTRYKQKKRGGEWWVRLQLETLDNSKEEHTKCDANIAIAIISSIVSRTCEFSLLFNSMRQDSIVCSVIFFFETAGGTFFYSI